MVINLSSFRLLSELYSLLLAGLAGILKTLSFRLLSELYSLLYTDLSGPTTAAGCGFPSPLGVIFSLMAILYVIIIILIFVSVSSRSYILSYK